MIAHPSLPHILPYSPALDDGLPQGRRLSVQLPWAPWGECKA